MAVFTLVSATGSPGVTTTALCLTLAWPRDAVLVDADSCAAQAVLAGYLHGEQAGMLGLTALAQAFRDGLDLTSDLPNQMMPLADTQGAAPRRWFVPGFARPGSAHLFDAVWPELAAALDDLDDRGIDVIIDAGRWAAQGPPASVVAHSRCLAVVTRTSLRALAALRLYVPALTSAVDGSSCRPGIIVVGPGMPYASDEVRSQFGLPVWGELPWQPGDAAGLSDGARVKAKPEARALARAGAVTAGTLRGIAQRWDQQVARFATPVGAAHV